MATPVITQTTQTYQGIPIVCARIICTEACSYKFQGVVNAPDDYLFQLVVKANAARTLTITCGGSVDTLDITSSFDRYVMAFPDVAVVDNDSLYIDFPAGTYYLYNLQLERGTNATKWQPAPEDAAAYTDAAINGQTQQDIFNKLTNNGETQGIYLSDGKLYLNATYIRSGTISADYIYGGTLTLGGETDGKLEILDRNNGNIGEWSEDGLITKVIRATDSVYINGSSGSYLKLAPYSDTEKYVEIKAANSLFHICGPYGTPHIFALISGTSLWYCVSDDTPEQIEAQTGTRRITQIGPGSVMLADNAGSETGYTLSLNREGFTSYYKSSSSNYVAVECTAARIVTHGTKNRAVNTDQYGERLYYCYETPSPMFGDVGEGEIGEDGLAYIWLDPIVAETVTNVGYQVFLQPYGEGAAYVKERTGAYFVIKGEPGLSFGWEVKGKQADYDQLRFEKVFTSEPARSENYGDAAVAYLNELHQRRISA